MQGIQCITSEQARQIIDDRSPLGLFYLKDNKSGVYVGIDNTSGEAYTEDFQTFNECIEWLYNY